MHREWTTASNPKFSRWQLYYENTEYLQNDYLRHSIIPIQLIFFVTRIGSHNVQLELRAISWFRLSHCRCVSLRDCDNTSGIVRHRHIISQRNRENTFNRNMICVICCSALSPSPNSIILLCYEQIKCHLSWHPTLFAEKSAVNNSE